MAQRTKESAAFQVELETEKLESFKGLPFRDLLSPETIMAAVESAGVEFRDQVYNPMVTLYAFLSQVIAKKDSSCQDGVKAAFRRTVWLKEKERALRMTAVTVRPARVCKRVEISSPTSSVVRPDAITAPMTGMESLPSGPTPRNRSPFSSSFGKSS